MLKRIVYGSGAMGILTAGYLLGSVSLGGAFAQTAPAATEQSEGNDQAESTALASLAKITTDQANTAALAQFAGGTVQKTELESENGTVVYGVKLTDSTGKKHDVKVDATSGKVLQAQSDGAEGPETPGASEAGETGS